jgi:hypothetical protein
MKKKFLLVILATVVVTVVFICAACQGVTQTDIDQQLSRWWVIYYKMMEDNTDMTGIVERPNGVDGILDSEFGNWMEQWDNLKLEERYDIVKRRNELMEEALVKLKGVDALREIDNVWSLDEVPQLWEKVNKEVN